MCNIFDVFTFVGFIATLATIFVFIIFLVSYVKDIVRDYKRKYQQKHRFDKPPTAKCYCIDCKYRTKYKECHVLGGSFKVADDWFCWKAEPKD